MLKPFLTIVFTANLILLTESSDKHHHRCRVNEMYAECPDAVCSPKTCDELGYPVPCFDLGPDGKCPSKPACICKEGYVRNNLGICIPVEFCPSCGGDENARSGCGTNCGKHCTEYLGHRRPCPKICYPNACDCKAGYYYDDYTKKCVLPQQCTICNKPNEEYSACIYDCPPQTCESLDRAYICLPDDLPCRAGCRCKLGYYRNLINECISEAECRKCSGPHEYYSCGGACDNVCATLQEQNQTNCPIINIKCNEMCYCQEGYARDSNNICIPINCCKESQCPPNEKYERCPSALCTPQTCSQLGFPINCPDIPQDSSCPGEPACVCNDGYLRNDEGVCIPGTECPSCGGDENAEPGCGFTCGKHCKDLYNDEPRACILSCIVNGCQCKPGKYYDEITKKCVDPSNCTQVCPDNEVLSDCVNGGCDRRNCSQLDQPRICIDPYKCDKGCICKNGYLRHPNGYCVPIDECPLPNCEENEVVSYCVNGGCEKKYCSQLEEPDICIDPIDCIRGCICKDGYLRNDNDVCVPINECSLQCGENEVLNGCLEALCEATTCQELGYPFSCILSIPTTCTEGCLCIDGYLRADNGTCIPAISCPSCGGDTNAVAGCGVYCNTRCSDIGEEPKSCNDICNVNTCDCKDGYYLDENTGKCVIPEDCSPTCGDNEVFNECLEAVCEALTCQELGYPFSCILSIPTTCTEGCLCIDGYLRADNGTCIPATSCPSCGGDTNAVAGCGVYCNTRCSDIGEEPKSCIDVCNANACDCKDGYYLDENTGKCVLPENCSLICGEDEVYSDCIQGQCGPKKCSDLGQPLPCPRIDPRYCIEGCLCKEGYLRDDDGICVPEDECTLTCGENEVINGCLEALCEATTCEDLGYPISCILSIPTTCTAGCVCIDGYLRSDNGICIPQSSCPSCGGDTNAVAGCGVYCNTRCSDIGDEPKACTAVCNINTCDCKDGYYLDENTGKCVLPENCSLICGEDEVYNDCIQGQCGPKKCSDLGQSLSCPRIDPRYCIEGCLCKEGYLRDDNGICVPENECTLTCGDNEVLNECLEAVCEATTCEDLGYPISCILSIPTTCTAGCLCIDGYLRADNGICIPASSCPSCGGDTNAVAGCGVYCNTRCSDIGEEPKLCPAVCNINACDCIDGYYLDENTGKCVLPDNCSSTAVTRTSTPVDTDVGLAKLRKGIIAMTGEFVYLLNELQPGVSFVLSAISVLIPYSQLALYAYGLILEQLLRATNLDSKDEIRTVLPSLIKKYQAPTTAEFEIAIKFYVNKYYPLSETFQREAREIFGSEGENVDFSQTDEAAKTINDWVSNKTHGLIDNLVDSSMLSDDTRVVLVNAIYFWDNWKNQFNPNDTENRDFYITPDKTKSIPTMYQENSFNYYESEELDAQILEMPYKADNFSFVLWLPRKKDGLSDIVEKLRNPDTFIESLIHFTREKVKVYLPVMKVESSIDMKDLSIKANITEMFSASDEFKGILKDDIPLYISYVVQQAQILVTETGTEAAAATGVAISVLSFVYPPPEIIIVDANHPYVYSVMFQGEPLFSGIFAGDL